MMNLARNGRVHPAVAKIATVLNIRVVGDAEGGTIVPVQKPRGDKKALQVMVEEMEARGLRDGNLIRTVSSSFGMIFGALNSTSVSYDPDFIVEFIPVGGSAIKPAEGTKIVVKSTRAILHEQTLPEKYDLFKVDDQFGVKFEMIDGTISVSLKRSNEFGFTKVMEYVYGITPTGFVQLAASGAMNGSFSSGLDCASVRTGNFSVDNFSVLNRDVHGVVETVSYLGNRLSIPEDYTDYENTWCDDDLLG
jgi:hypothetical protein